MQRIANLIVLREGKVLLLKKPRRGWYVAPGGKMEPGESVYQAAIREFSEETNTIPTNPHIKGIYTMVIVDQDTEEVIDEWMLYTFIAEGLTGDLLSENREGVLEWHPVESLKHLPMAKGDRSNLLFAVSQPGIQYGTFIYTNDFELLKEDLQSSNEGEL